MPKLIPVAVTVAFLWLLLAQAQEPSSPPPAAAASEPAEKPVEWVCPMDPDVRGKGPAKCRRCGMALVPGIPDIQEFPVRVRPTPKVIQPGSETRLDFEVLHPKDAKRVRDFELVHEKFFHLFIVSRDLSYFVHEHPEPLPDGRFRFDTKFPKPGMFRILTDFYPKNATPQLASNTLFVRGTSESPKPLIADLNPQKGENVSVSLTTEPPKPLAGFKTLLFCKLDPAGGLEQYLGAWGHMLAASEDLVDMIHVHPFIADGGPNVQFNIIFPRPGIYKVWVQFQRQGVVNTVAFQIPVEELK